MQIIKIKNGNILCRPWNKRGNIYVDYVINVEIYYVDDVIHVETYYVDFGINVEIYYVDYVINVEMYMSTME